MPQGNVIAIVEDGFEDVELTYPRYRLKEADYDVVVATPDGKPRKGKHGYPVEDVESIDAVDVQRFDALLLPGGVANPDKLRMNEKVVGFVRSFVTDTDKPVFAICHAPWTLVEADVLNGVKMTSYWSLRKDVENAGAKWKDQPVVVDGRWVTSRYPEDLPEFGKAIVDVLTGRVAERAGARAAEAR